MLDKSLGKSTVFRCCLVLLVVGLASFGAQPLAAQAVERLGEFGDWGAFAFMDDGSKVCFIASSPKEAKGDYTRRGEVFVRVTHWPEQNRRNEVSFVAGYSFRKDSWVEVRTDNGTFRLFTDEDTAWATDKQTDEQLVQAMIKGSKMVVEGTSSRGTLTTDTYSLIGFTNAYEAINSACGVQ